MIFHRLPKKLWRELSCAGNQENTPVGWGIYITEGFNWRLVVRCLWCALIITNIPVVLWCVLKRDIPGGMGIGQYSASLLAIFASLLVAEKSMDD
jgi:hypothetical protein